MWAFDRRSHRYEFREVVFEGGAARLSAPNPPLCLGCHGADPRPIWGSYPVWKGAYAEFRPHGDSDDSAEIVEKNRQFYDRQNQHPRYREIDHYGVSEQSAPSFRRGKLAGDAIVDDTGLGRITMSGDQKTARSGTFLSGILDARSMVVWDRAIWDGKIPAGATATLNIRTGSTLTPDRTWSDWQKVPATGRITGTSRYIQYKATMSSGAGVTAPSLWAIGFSNNGKPPAKETEGR